MGTFKQWLQNEISLGSDGMRDNASAQTAQSTQKVGDYGLSNQKFDDERAKIQQLAGNPSVARDQLIKVSSDVIDHAPGTVAKNTNGPQVAQYIARQMGMPKLFPNNPRLMMRKKMRKGMQK